MRFLGAFAFVLVGLVGCSTLPSITRGTFDKSYSLTMQRGSYEIVVETSRPASYTISNYHMTHPMGSRPDTEATFKTSAGTFKISDKNVVERGVNINGTFYQIPEVSSESRPIITIDAKGDIKVGQKPMNAPAPTGATSKGDKP